MNVNHHKDSRISVIVTNYNYEFFLEETIDSLRSQQLSLHEIIIVDDASSDNSRELIQRLAAESSNIVPVLLEENVGQLAAFNAGVALATGDIISFIDADDTWQPNYTTEVAQVFLKEPECDYLFTGYRQFGDATGEFLTSTSKETTNHGPTQLLTWVDQSTWLSGPTSSISISSELADKLFPIPLEQEWRICADAALQMLAALEGANKFNLHKPLMNYRTHESNQFLGQQLCPKKELAMRLSRAKTVSWYADNQGRFLRALTALAAVSDRGQLKLAQLLALESSVGTKTKSLISSYSKSIDALQNIKKRRKKELLKKLGVPVEPPL